MKRNTKIIIGLIIGGFIGLVAYVLFGFVGFMLCFAGWEYPTFCSLFMLFSRSLLLSLIIFVLAGALIGYLIGSLSKKQSLKRNRR